jgi:hypothetical protein
MGINFSRPQAVGVTGYTPPDTHPHANEGQAPAPNPATTNGGMSATAHPPRRASHGPWSKVFKLGAVQGSGKQPSTEIAMPVFSGNAYAIANLRMKFSDDAWRERKSSASALAALFHRDAEALATALVTDIDAMTNLPDAGATKRQVSDANKQFDKIYGWVFGKTKFAQKKTAVYMNAFSQDLKSRIEQSGKWNPQPGVRVTKQSVDIPEAAELPPAELETIQRQFRFTESLAAVPTQAEPAEVRSEPHDFRNQYVSAPSNFPIRLDSLAFAHSPVMMLSAPLHCMQV